MQSRRALHVKKKKVMAVTAVPNNGQFCCKVEFVLLHFSQYIRVLYNVGGKGVHCSPVTFLHVIVTCCFYCLITLNDSDAWMEINAFKHELLYIMLVSLGFVAFISSPQFSNHTTTVIWVSAAFCWGKEKLLCTRSFKDLHCHRWQKPYMHNEAAVKLYTITFPNLH